MRYRTHPQHPIALPDDDNNHDKTVTSTAWPAPATRQLVSDTDLCVLVFSVTDRRSFNLLPAVHAAVHDLGKPTVVVAAKADVPREQWAVSAAEMAACAAGLGAGDVVPNASARLGTGLEGFDDMIIRRVVLARAAAVGMPGAV